MASTTTEDIRLQFKNAVGKDDKLVEECVNICHIYNLTPEELYWKWEAQKFTTGQTKTHSEVSELTMDAIGAIKQAIVRDRKSTTQTQQAAKKKRNNLLVASISGAGKRNMPAFMTRNLALHQAGMGDVKMENAEASTSLAAGPSNIQFQCPPPKEHRDNRYMREKMKDRSSVLDSRIRAFSDLIYQHYHIQIGDPTSLDDNEIVAVGRITQDSESSDASKLNESSLTLEPSHVISNLPRIPLRFDPNFKLRGAPRGVLSVGFFPGAIVAVKGKNGSGEWFTVSEILTLPPPEPTPNSSPGSPFTMAVASGPFSPDSDLEYKPFHQFIQSIQTSNPSVLLLVGPFIDSSHPKIKIGDVNYGPMDMFHKFIANPLKGYLDTHPGAIALLVPSVKDLISAHCVIPQAEFEAQICGGDSRIKLLPNPGRFTLNGLTFGATSLDIVFQLKTQEVKIKAGEQVEPVDASPDDGDAFGSVCRHVLQQRSFYPIFPVPSDLTHEVNIDIAHSSKRPGLRLTSDFPSNTPATIERGGIEWKVRKDEDDETGCYAPDVLILPSRLKQFCKVIHSTVSVNPSFLVKGSYSLLNVDPTKSAQSKERVRVEVVKLPSDITPQKVE